MCIFTGNQDKMVQVFFLIKNVTKVFAATLMFLDVGGGYTKGFENEVKPICRGVTE